MTDARFIFTEPDWENLDLVRQIVLHRLKTDGNWHQMDYYWALDQQKVVSFDPPRLQARFVVLANEVMWQLIAQGVVTPGLNASNPTLPFFRLTDHGQKVLAEERFLPHDPSGYLQEIRGVARDLASDATIGYLEEALRCFTTGSNLASVLLLGVAAETVFRRLCKVVAETLKDSKEKAAFQKLPDHMKPRHRWLVQKYEALPKSVRDQLPESVQLTLSSLYEMIRQQRNELGHPEETLPAVDRERAFLFFKLFPRFLGDLEALAAHCRSHGI